MIVLKGPQDQLLAALTAVSGIVERRHTLPILANVLMKREGDEVEFISSDLEIQVRTRAPFAGDAGPFATTVGARKLIDILKSLPSDQICSLTSNQSKLTLQAGKSRFTLQTLPAEDFPLVQEAPDFGPAFAVPQATLKALINQVHFAMAVHDIRFYLNGILFVAEGHTLTLVATDGHRLAMAQATLEVEMPKQEVILPRKTVLELQRLLKDSGKDENAGIEMRFSGNQARFSFSGMEFVTKLVEGKFPDYNRVIPKGHRHHLVLGRQPLLSALQRAAILTSDKFKAVRLSFADNLLTIAASNAEQEEAKEEIEIDYAGDPIETGFNVQYLTEVLANMPQEMVGLDLHDSASSALFTVPERQDFKYVVMPMRI
ncbi:DNA polymerase-3 subunit beta [Inhella inkyongensis]|uniref:Beta sliding clamp n=1 Tax=Inhella inkyongensis TaxID=392593 RepID=A0A840S9M9_9BURK|nr:DNA polymerase III subunit beta [Inhella inkyongensis]MBB5205221.1 DNA polymerase-3 subunit beta [Inhella inkyongensis]